VGSYPTFSPLPVIDLGGLFSVPLSLTLRWPSVRWNPVLWQLGLSSFSSNSPVGYGMKLYHIFLLFLF